MLLCVPVIIALFVLLHTHAITYSLTGNLLKHVVTERVGLQTFLVRSLVMIIFHIERCTFAVMSVLCFVFPFS